MIKPEWLKNKDTIGVTAVSDGIDDEQDERRFHNGVRKLNESGYNVKMTDNVFRCRQTGKKFIRTYKMERI